MKWRRDLQKLTGQQRGPDVRFTTLFDLYGLPANFPGMEEHCSVADTRRRVDLLEAAIRAAVRRIARHLSPRQPVCRDAIIEEDARLCEGPEAPRTPGGIPEQVGEPSEGSEHLVECVRERVVFGGVSGEGCDLDEALAVEAEGVAKCDHAYMECDHAYMKCDHAYMKCDHAYMKCDHAHVNGGHVHVNEGHVHVNGGHVHVNEGHVHVNGGHVHVNEGHVHVNEGHAHVNGGHAHVNGGHAHVNGGHAHVNGGHAHVNGGHAHV